MKWAAALLGSVLLLARLVAAQPEILHPPGSAAPVEGLPILLEFGGTGSNDDAFTSGECVEVFTDPVCVGGTNAGGACVGASACPGGTCGLKKLRSAGDACGTGSGTPAPTVTPFACGTGYAVQVVGATPGCVLLPTPDGAGAGAAATQTPWSCGAGNGARGMGGTPECFVVPTPDGSVATVTPGGGTPQPIATSTSAPGSADGFARVDHVHHIADGAIGAAKLAFTVPTPDGTPNPGDVTAVGSCTDGACLTDGKATSGSMLFVWEGSTVDGNQLTINAGSSDPAAAHILVVPDTDGILVATVDGAEQDPQVGTRTSGAYCKGDGSAVQCTTTTVELASGGTGAALTDPNADRIMFWDDSAGATAYLEPSTGLAIQGTAIVAVTPVYYATPTPVPTPGSDPALAAGQCAWANGYDGLVCEGSTANTIETHLVAANPTTSDKTITLPDATGTVALLEQSQTFTGVNTFTNDVVIGGGTQTTLQQVTVQSGYDFYFTDGSGNGAQFTAASDLFAPYGTGTVRANDVSCASAPCVTLSSEVTGTLPLANGGTGAALTDPNADRIMFWDDSAGATAYLEPSTGLAIQGTAIVAVTPVYYATPTPWATPATLCATVGPFLGGLAGVNPPVCLPTNVATPTPVPSPTGDFVRKDSAASDPQSMANALEITFPAAGSTPGFVMLPSSEPGVGEEMFAIYPRSSRDPIMQVQSQTDTGAVRTHHLGFRLDRGTDTGSFAATNPQKPVEFILGTAASPLHVSDGISGIELTSVVAFDDVDLELGNFQSYVVVDSSNTNPFYAVGVSSNITLQGTGGDGTPWTVSEVPASAFKSYSSLAETGSIDRHAAGFVAQAGLNTASGTAANAYYYGFYGPFFDLIGCTSPGTCIDMEEAGALYVPDFSDVGAFPNRFSVKSLGATVRMEHAGNVHVGPTPTPTPTATATSVTPTATAVTPTPTATATPLVDVDGHLAIAGNLMLKNTGSDRLLQPMGRVNQAGLTFTVQGIDAVMMANNGTTSLIGGALTLKGGVGTYLARGGDVTVQGGDGFSGSDVNVTAPLTFSGALTASGRILMTGHISTKQTGSPSVSSCGTSPSVTGNDHNGTITVGTSATSCTLTFGRGWANTPQCFANDRTAVLEVRAVPTTTTVVFDTATASNIASDTIDYWCVGRE